MENETNGAETAEIRLKRLRMRSWRRGMKEMDLILGGFADAELPKLTGPDLATYEELLNENDQELYKWVSGAAPTPSKYASLLGQIGQFHGIES